MKSWMSVSTQVAGSLEHRLVELVKIRASQRRRSMAPR
jgi:hypothetical protein